MDQRRGVKVTPPEREVIRALSAATWASAAQIAQAVRWPTSKVTVKLRRLASLGLVESMPGSGGKVYRLTKAGALWRSEHVAEPWVPLHEFDGNPIFHVLRHRDTKAMCDALYPWEGPQRGSRWGVRYGDGRFAWEPVTALEVRTA